MSKRKNLKTHKRSYALILTLALLVGSVIGGTVAWLMDSTGTVTNTFTVGDINIDLWENEFVNGMPGDGKVVSNDDYKIVPGTEQDKNPTVTIKGGSENSYVFVQVQEVNNSNPQYVDWDIEDAWTLLEKDSEKGVYTYYLTDDYTTKIDDLNITVLKGNQVSYPDTLTKENINALYTTMTTDGNTVINIGIIDADKQPKLIFKAFAVQLSAASSAESAWNEVDDSEKLSNSAN